MAEGARRCYHPPPPRGEGSKPLVVSCGGAGAGGLLVAGVGGSGMGRGLAGTLSLGAEGTGEGQFGRRGALFCGM